MHILRHSRFFLISFALLLCSNTFAVDKPYDIVITKSSQNLKVMNGEQIVKQFRIAYGMGGKDSKRIQGDKKTPSGTYKIINFKDDSQFHYFMQIDYPNLLDAWYGYKNQVISADEFKYISTTIKNDNIPPQDTKLGGFIGIHGIGKTNEEKLAIHHAFNWTQGCIGMTNEEINMLRKYVDIGTRVTINE